MDVRGDEVDERGDRRLQDQDRRLEDVMPMDGDREWRKERSARKESSDISVREMLFHPHFS